MHFTTVHFVQFHRSWFHQNLMSFSNHRPNVPFIHNRLESIQSWFYCQFCVRSLCLQLSGSSASEKRRGKLFVWKSVTCRTEQNRTEQSSTTFTAAFVFATWTLPLATVCILADCRVCVCVQYFSTTSMVSRSRKRLINMLPLLHMSPQFQQASISAQLTH